ncbi:uncharacterized protein LOC143182671 [Calliopsis andreniformis]|uniref:uncharacterized protein LOC143182671 n=1 Tax=Calliopsis andreniformis TaxID=337506 RepID=UPI003FCCD17A
MTIERNAYIQCFSLAYFFFHITGLSSGKKGFLVQFQKCLIMLILLSFVLVQLAVFITHKYTFELFLKVAGWTLPVLICIIKYISFLICSDCIVYVENWFEDEWNSFTSDREHEILLKHGNNGKLVNITFAG